MASGPEPFDPYEGCDVLRAVVERGIWPFRDLPPEELEELRDFLIVHTTTHPAMEPLYTRLKKRAAAGRSGVEKASSDGEALEKALAGVLRGARRGRP
jgi:hypothetical protein